MGCVGCREIKQSIEIAVVIKKLIIFLESLAKVVILVKTENQFFAEPRKPLDSRLCGNDGHWTLKSFARASLIFHLDREILGCCPFPRDGGRLGWAGLLLFAPLPTSLLPRRGEGILYGGRLVTIRPKKDPRESCNERDLIL